MKVKLKFKDGEEYIGDLTYRRYSSTDRICLFVESLTEGPIAKLTGNMSEIDLLPNEVFIKDYDRNEGFYEQLVEQNIIDKAHTVYNMGDTDKNFYQCVLKVDISTLSRPKFS